jgi:preprotein translocase subunit SecF
MNIIGKRNIFLGFSGTVVLLSLVAILFLGLKPGIDLKGGTQWEVAFGNQNVSEDAIVASIGKVTPGAEVSAKKTSDGSFIIRLGDVSEEQHQAYLGVLKSFGEVSEKNFSSIGPTVGSELRRRSLWAIVAVMFGISLYIAYAFRKVSDPIKSWKYGVVTLVTLLHDVIIPAGLLALLGWWQGIEIDTNFIVALLVVMGFSVHDTIVVFDRIRENLIVKRNQKMTLEQIINHSVNETFVRSVNTSLTLIIVLIATLILGPASLFYFVLTILVGTIFGTYSSIFVASPLLFLWGRRGT